MHQFGKHVTPNFIQIGKFPEIVLSQRKWSWRFIPIFRLELHTESGNTKPELIFMDQIEEVSPDYVQYKNEQCIQIRHKDGIRDARIVLTNPVSRNIKLIYLDRLKYFNEFGRLWISIQNSNCSELMHYYSGDKTFDVYKFV